MGAEAKRTSESRAIEAQKPKIFQNISKKAELRPRREAGNRLISSPPRFQTIVSWRLVTLYRLGNRNAINGLGQSTPL
jgi:hypothetical protein